LEAATPASAVLASLSTVPDVLNDFPDVVNVGKTLPVPSHDVQHHIRTTGPPIASRFRRLEGSKLEAARREFEEMERDGIIQRSTSPWASPLHMVPKKDGTWRPCGDFRRLNLVTEPDVYPLPNMLDFADRLSGCTVFSKIDLRKGYWQVPVRPEDRPKTAVITPFGLFEFLRMPFGLRNAGSSFQRMMDRVLAGLPFAYCYLDDLRVASPSLEVHRQHLRAVFERLRLFGLVINLEKCVFAVDSFEFLGHVVSAQGARPISSYVEAVERRPPPTTVKELQVFLGLINFYRRFLPGIAVILRPLTDALKGGRAASDLLAWTPEMEASFVAAKAALGEATWLGHPDPEARLVLHVDASASHIGAALHQQSKGHSTWQPLGFFSRKLETAQTKWSAFDRELLACVDGIRHFRFILEGRAFTIFTDHKPLVGALARVSDPWTARQCRHLAYVAEFTADIQHVAGLDNIAADALSRPPISTVTASSLPWDIVSDLRGIASRQSTCPSTLQARSSPSLQVQAREVEGVSLWCDGSTGRWRPLVPQEDRLMVFKSIHGVAHPGIRATRRMVAARFVWPNMRADIASWCRDCVACQRAKVTKQPRASIQPIPIPRRRFSHVHVDLVGPLPASEDGYVYVMTMIDRTTRWLEAAPLKHISASSCVEAFLSTWVARFGVPETLTSDRGTQFASASWTSFCNKIGTRHVMTTAYHPQANGLVERSHRQLKDALRAREAGVDWPTHLPWVLLGLRAAPKEVSGISSAEAVLGQPLVLPGELSTAVEASPTDFQSELASEAPPVTWQPRTYAEAVSGPTNQRLQQAEFVYVKRGGCGPPLSPAYSGPYRVIRPGCKYFLVEVGGRHESVSVDRLKPHTGSSPVPVSVPPRRGRPPKLPPLPASSASP
jgi:cleavage and polyadenylation specificity factor subunit 1